MTNVYKDTIESFALAIEGDDLPDLDDFKVCFRPLEGGSGGDVELSNQWVDWDAGNMHLTLTLGKIAQELSLTAGRRYAIEVSGFEENSSDAIPFPGPTFTLRPWC